MIAILTSQSDKGEERVFQTEGDFGSVPVDYDEFVRELRKFAKVEYGPEFWPVKFELRETLDAEPHVRYEWG